MIFLKKDPNSDMSFSLLISLTILRNTGKKELWQMNYQIWYIVRHNGFLHII